MYHGLPAIKTDRQWLVLSPYTQCVAEINDRLLGRQETYDQLAKAGFFGEPSLTGPGSMSDYFQLTLIMTSDCNLRCRYCFVNAGDTNFYIDQAVANAAVRYAVDKAKGRRLMVSFFGGEPTLAFDRIKQTVVFAREAVQLSDATGVSFNITTNGVMPDSVLEFLIEHDFFATISMDGVPDVQNTQRPLRSGGASSERVERTIARLVEAKREFIVRSTLTAESTPRLVEEVDYLGSMGVTQLHVEAINLAGRAVLETKGQPMARPTAQVFCQNLIAAIKRGAEVGVDILNSAYMNLLQPSVYFCDGVGGNRVSVTYNGEVTTCLEVQGGCHPTAERFIAGCYDPGSDKLVIDRDHAVTACGGAPIIDQSTKCVDCFARFACGGGCPIRNFHTTGDTAVVDPFRCEVVSCVLPFVIELMAEYAE